MPTLDDEITQALRRAAPAPPTEGLELKLERRRRRRATRRGAGRVALATVVLVGTGVGVYALNYAFRASETVGVAEPTVENGRLLVVRSVGGRDHIFSVEPDGTDAMAVSEGGAHYRSPTISPDGLTVAFEHELPSGPQVIATLPIEGGVVTWLTNPNLEATQPAWSPDGSQIAFVSARDQRIYVTDEKGGNPTPVTTPDLVASSPIWAPDGTQIAFSAYERISTGLVDDALNRDLYVVEIDRADSPRAIVPTPDVNEVQPAWSPDGAKIAFISTPITLDDTPVGGVATIRPDGTDFTQITNDGAFEQHPTWSPDGSLIAFDRDDPEGTSVYTIRPDGSALTRVALGSDPAWQSLAPGVTTQPEPQIESRCTEGQTTAWEFDGDGDGAADSADLVCGANAEWTINITWSGGAEGSWALPCGELCEPWATPDLDGDGDQELMIWSARPTPGVHDGYVFIMDGYPTKAWGPLRVVGAHVPGLRSDDPALFPVGGDETRLAALACEEQGGQRYLTWTLSTRNADGTWWIETERFEVHAGQTEVAGDRLVYVGGNIITHWTKPIGQPTSLCGAPIVGPHDSRTRDPGSSIAGGEQTIPGVPFKVCRPMTIPGDFGPGLDTVWVFEKERVPGAGCIGSEGFQYVGVGTPDGVEILSEEIHDIGQNETSLWPYATPDIDGKGIDEIAIGIAGSRADGFASFVFFRLLDGAVEHVRFDCGPACSPISWITVGQDRGAYCGPLGPNAAADPYGVRHWSSSNGTEVEDTYWLLDGPVLRLVGTNRYTVYGLPPSGTDVLCDSSTYWPEEFPEYPDVQ